jgi:hypothetical protein
MQILEISGTLFSIVLDRLFGANLAYSDVAGNLVDVISQIQSQISEPGVTVPKARPMTNVRLAKGTLAPAEDPDEEVEAKEQLRNEEAELAKLKQQLAERSGLSPDIQDSMVDLMARSGSFLKAHDKSEYHIFPFRSQFLFDGILSHLANLYQGNPHDTGKISVSSKSTCGDYPGYHPKHASDVNKDSGFYSAGSQGEFIEYDFKEMRVAVTRYSIRAYNDAVNGTHLRSWVMKARDENGTWHEIDCQKDCASLNGPRATCDFPVRSVVEARSIRLEQTGLSWSGSHYVALEALELFGGLRIPS